MEGQEIVFHEKQRRSEQGARMQYLSYRSIVLDLPSDHQTWLGNPRWRSIVGKIIYKYGI